MAVARPGVAHGVGAFAPDVRAAPARNTTSRSGLFACLETDGRSRLAEAAVSKTAEGSSILPARAHHNYIETGLHGHRTRDPAERPTSTVAPGSPSQGRGDHHPTQTRQGVGANSTVNSIRQAPDPIGSVVLPAAVTRSETSGTPAPRHMCRLGKWLARLVVTQVPSGRAGSSPARRTSPRKHCGDAPDSYSGEQGSIPWRGTGR